MTTKVDAVRLRYEDSDNNSHKYYYGFIVQANGGNSLPIGLVRWGRVGTTGQWKVIPPGAVRGRIEEKEHGGYTSTMGWVRFELDDLTAAKIRVDDKSAYVNLSTAFDAFIRVGGRPSAQPPTQATTPVDAPVTDAEREAFRLLLLKQVGAKPVEPVEAETPAVDPNSMEAKLAAALARAKGKQNA